VTETTDSDPVLVDSSGWLEYIAGDTKANLFSPYLRRDGGRPIIVPTIVLYEVRKILLLRRAATVADRFVSEALRHTVVPISDDIALSAATISLQCALAMADSLIYAVTVKLQAELVTSDGGFKNLPRVTLL
jgi:predicted nucleic acid-binding protein